MWIMLPTNGRRTNGSQQRGWWESFLIMAKIIMCHCLLLILRAKESNGQTQGTSESCAASAGLQLHMWTMFRSSIYCSSLTIFTWHGRLKPVKRWDLLNVPQGHVYYNRYDPNQCKQIDAMNHALYDDDAKRTLFSMKRGSVCHIKGPFSNRISHGECWQN
jgi:hypothetical protein